ncbi:hypothetical protein CsSME_00039341 [Camellia sinensis var. sinensis]
MELHYCEQPNPDQVSHSLDSQHRRLQVEELKNHPPLKMELHQDKKLSSHLLSSSQQNSNTPSSETKTAKLECLAGVSANVSRVPVYLLLAAAAELIINSFAQSKQLHGFERARIANEACGS